MAIIENYHSDVAKTSTHGNPKKHFQNTYISRYLNCRRHPEKLASFLQDPAARLETNETGELVPQRRERYVFRPVLIKILEQYFLDTPFPDFNKRVEIATACNNALQQDKKGTGVLGVDFNR